MKKSFPRAAALTAAAALAVSLAGCTPGYGDYAAPLATQESAPDTAPASGELQMLSHGTDDGYYLSLMDLTRGSEDRTDLLGYVDYAQTRAAVLCAQPNCTHSDGNCPAWQGVWGGSAWALPGGEHIVTNTVEDSGEEQVYVLTLCAPDGTEEKTLCRSANNNIPTMTDDHWLYCLTGQGLNLWRVPLDGGEPEELVTLNAYDVEGCLGREIFYPVYGSAEQADGTALTTLTYTAYNIDTGATRVLLDVSYSSDNISNPYLDMDGATLYWYDPAAGSLCVVDVKTGEESRMPVNWDFSRAGCGTIYQTTPCAVVDGKLIVDQYGDMGSCRAAVNPADGSAYELTLGYIRNGRSESVQILARSSHGLLVKYENRLTSKDEVKDDGSVGTVDIEQVRLALIDPEAFLQNQPDYRDIAPVEGFDGEFVC